MPIGPCIELYNSILSKTFDSHCPLISKRYRTDCIRPIWYNGSLQKIKQMRRRAERRYKKSPTILNKSKLKQIRNVYNIKLKTTRTDFFKTKILNSMSDPKILFKTLGNLTGNKKQIILPNYDTNNIVAEQFSDFYVNKITNIRKQIGKKSNECNFIYFKSSKLHSSGLFQRNQPSRTQNYY